MMESPSVAKDAGCHLHNWVDQKGQQLRKAIEGCLEDGLSRLEITFYECLPTTVAEAEAHLFRLADLMHPVVRRNPIRRQWSNLCAKLGSTVVLVNAATGRWELVRWFSSCSEKRNAVVGNKPKYQNPGALLQALAHCSLAKLPVLLVLYGGSPESVRSVQWKPVEEAADRKRKCGYDDAPFAKIQRVHFHTKHLALVSSSTLFLKESALYSQQCVQADPSAYGIMETENLTPAMLRTPLRANAMCTPALTIDGQHFEPPSAPDTSLAGQLASSRSAAKRIEQLLGCKVRLVEVHARPYRTTKHWYGLDESGNQYRLPELPQVEYTNGCEVSVSLQGKVSVDGYAPIDWTKRAAPLAALPDDSATTHEVSAVSGRKLALRGHEQLYLQHRDAPLATGTRFRKVSVRQRTAVLHVIHNNTAS
jgi:hypothetical protein